MKKSIGILQALALVIGMAFSAVSATNAAPLEIKFATQNPTTAPIHSSGYVAWAKKMEEATEGRLKVTIYPAQTLGKGTEFFDLVKMGVADMVFGIPTSTPGQHPLTDIFNLPFLGFTSAAQAGLIQWKIFNQYPEFFEEYEGVKIIGVAATGPYFFATTSKSVETLDDLKGLKLRVPGGRPANSLKAAGGSPVMIPMPEVYLSLEKGIIDGAPVPWEGPLGYLPLKSIKYWSMGWGLYSTPFFIGMNPRTWDKISEEDQNAIMGVWGEYGAINFSKAVWDDSSEPAMKALKDHGIEVVHANPESVNKWAEINKPINQSYIDELEAKNLPAQKIYDSILEMVKETTK